MSDKGDKSITVLLRENINIHYCKKLLKLKKNIMFMMKIIHLKLEIKFQLLSLNLFQKTKKFKVLEEKDDTGTNRINGC